MLTRLLLALALGAAPSDAAPSDMPTESASPSAS